MMYLIPISNVTVRSKVNHNMNAIHGSGYRSKVKVTGQGQIHFKLKYNKLPDNPGDTIRHGPGHIESIYYHNTIRGQCHRSDQRSRSKVKVTYILNLTT